MFGRTTAALAAWCWLAAMAQAADGPQPPCAGEALPAYPPAGQPPVARAWFAEELGEAWMPDACLGWPGGAGLVVVALAGRFAEDQGMAAIQRRLGAISAQNGILYWSATRQVWRPLFAETWALSGPDRERRRGDFPPEQLTPGSELFVWQKPSDPYSGGVYRLSLIASSGQQLELAEVNVTPQTFLGMTVFPVGGQQARLWIEAEVPGRYRYYAISRLSGTLPFGLPRASAINRAVALFRYAAGIATDLEPPAAP